MRFRTEQRPDGDSVAAWHGGRWVPLRQALDRAGQAPGDVLGADPDDLVGILGGGAPVRDRITSVCEQVAGDELGSGEPVLPFQPRSLRGFSQWQRHWEQAARVMAGRYHPLRTLAGPAIRGYEALTRRTFPALRPGREFFQHPVYYTGNHLTVLPDGATVRWPPYCRDLDYELEFGMVVTAPLLDAGPEEALAAIGGFVLFNDLSARDTQWQEYEHGLFGPVVKTKNFASALGAEVVTPDEVLPWIDELAGEVLVNGQTWARTSTAGMRHSLGDVVAWASYGEQLRPGELITSGTLPGGSGMELDRWLQPGDEVTLRIERIGSVTSLIGARPDPSARPARWSRS